MAKCKAVEVVKPDYILEISAKEAGALLDVFASVGGQPTGSRGLIDAVNEALLEAGAERAHAPYDGGSYYFRDGKDIK